LIGNVRLPLPSNYLRSRNSTGISSASGSSQTSYTGTGKIAARRSYSRSACSMLVPRSIAG
jgi:hypothetical protein